MIEKYVFPGERLELKAVRREAGADASKTERTYESKVYDVLSDDRIEVVMPMEQTKLILLPVDGEYEMFFYTENGLYECVGRIVDRYKSNNVYILLVELETNLRKYQRREYYRYSCALDMDARNLFEEEIDKAENDKGYKLVPGLPLKRSVIVDISGGGLRFISDYKYEKGSYIYCKYHLFVKGSAKDYEIVCKILDVRELEQRPGEYEHRVQYMNLDVDEREEIIQFIFEEERRNRHKNSGF
ncbi:MAG: flagellar brake protein [Lachnospiraceae bacterium]|nr:flagellar brake protein [Candidatus Colinaster equi]